jgi:short-subunit dehydrogenase
MIERGSGLVVNISSVAAVLSSPGEAAYDASKAALSVFSEAMAIDLWETGVRVLVAYPGVVDTELFSVPDNDPLSPTIAKIPVAEFADGVMDAIARDALQIYVPAWFEKIASGKAADVETFLAGSANWVRQQPSET